MIRFKITQFNRSILALGKYSIEYINGTIIEAPENTLGFMLFDNLLSVFYFMKKMKIPHNFKEREYSIKEIETLDKEKYPINVSSGVYELAITFFYKNKNKLFGLGEYFKSAPPGTICCNKIRVIRDLDIKEY